LRSTRELGGRGKSVKEEEPALSLDWMKCYVGFEKKLVREDLLVRCRPDKVERNEYA
jgi:hypothetical protein